MSTFELDHGITVHQGYSQSTANAIFIPRYREAPRMPPLDRQYCPLCASRAVRNSDGTDQILHTLHDHEPPAIDSKSGDWVYTGTVFRIRCCATCGHLWSAMTKPPKEQACTPAK